MRFVKESRLAATPAEVFAFHERPDALAQLTPPWGSAEVIESPESLRPGNRAVLRVRLGPIALRWVAVHEEYEPPHLFADRQESGPFARWFHWHRMIDDGRGGTLLRDEIDFEPPGGSIGRLLIGPIVLRKLEALFAYRHERTRRIVEQGHAPGRVAARGAEE